LWEALVAAQAKAKDVRMTKLSPRQREVLFRKRLRELREGRGFSQSELAKKAGLQTSAISHFETGRRLPSFNNLHRLIDGLEYVTMDYLTGRQAIDGEEG
jgi:transcriptional regulator with XRE-family HTH domain